MSHTKTLRRIGILLISCFVGIDTVGVIQKKSAIAATEIDLQVGIVQRFGDEPIDE